MFKETSNHNKLYAVWKKDPKSGDAYIVIESEVYPLRLKLDTLSEDSPELVKKGIKELLSKLNLCCQCCDQEIIANDITNFLTNKGIAYTTLKQWFLCRYEAIYE